MASKQGSQERSLQVFTGTFVHSTQVSPVQILNDHILGVDKNGKIVFFEASDKEEKLSETWHFNKKDIRVLQPMKEFFIPGLVDTHIHASQYSNIGTGLDLTLLPWLTKYTFPVEAKYKDLKFAEDIYTKVVERTLKNGTTTACYFATIHTDASLKLCDIVDNYGQRALVGKVCMDINDTFHKYKEETSHSLEETQRFVTELAKRKYPRVKPIVTPRFAASCSSELLKQLGLFAKHNNLHIQSHISETRPELEITKRLFEKYENYTDVYYQHNLLTDKTVMAHGVYLSDEELKVFHREGAAISHCPNSNISLCSGLLDMRNVLKHQVKVGLGTDVSGGYSASMLDAIRRAIDTTKILSVQSPGYEKLSYKEIFRIATLGGSQALGLDKLIGNFEVGKEFDALLINVDVPNSAFEMFPGETNEDIFQKFLLLGDDRNIEEVYVAGKQVVPFLES
uniref:Guanine deaminase n=1 Tax=Callorhinchus milii TaxID=7868 RepID=V9KM42_CALMI